MIGQERFIIGYRYTDANDKLQLKVEVVKAFSINAAIELIVNIAKIPQQYIKEDQLDEGILYCRPIYNPLEIDEGID